MRDNDGYWSGTLQRTDTGRWSIGENYEITSGERFELHIDGEWELVRMEFSHSIGGYYTIPDRPLRHGMKARQGWYGK